MFNKELALKQAEAYLRANKISAAIEEYKNIFQATKDLNTLNILGDLYIRLGDMPKAISSFLLIAEDYTKDGQIVKAIAMYKKLQKFAPSDPNILLKLAELHTKKKLLGDARLYYTQALDIYKKADKRMEVIKTLQALVEVNPENLPNRMELAKICQAEGLFTEAHDSYLETGQMLLKLGITNEAIDLFERALSIAHNPNLALKYLIETLAQNDQLEKASKIVEQEIEKNPNNIDPLIILGKTYLMSMQLDEAERIFIQLVYKDPSRYEYLLRIASMFLEEKEFDRTVEAIKPIIDIVVKTKQKRKLTSILKEILKQDPNHIPTLNALVNIYEKLQENSNLISTLKLLVKACINYGLSYEATMALRQLIQLEPAKNTHKEKLQDLEKATITGKLNANATAGLAKVALPKITGALATNPSQAKTSDDPESTKNLMDGMLSMGSSFVDAQLQLLESMVSMDPDYWQARVKLKNSYLQKNLIEQATEQCIEIAKIHNSQGNLEEEQKVLAEAYSLSPHRKEELIELGLKEEQKPIAPKLPPPITPLINKLAPTPNTPFTMPPKVTPKELSLEDNSFEIDLSSIFANVEKRPELPLKPVEVVKLEPVKATETVISNISMSFINAAEFCQANKILDKEWKRAIRNNQDISLIAIKIDKYPEKRKLFGDVFINEAIKGITSIIEENINDGGEQLLSCELKDSLILMLPETNVTQALTTAKTIGALMFGLRITQEPFSLSLSQAIASLKPNTSNSPADLVEKVAKNVAKLTSQSQILAD